MKTRIIIPARLKSTRFPNKLIQLINNISLIEHICIRAKKIPCYSVIVATDDIKIKSLVEQHGIDVWFSKKKFLNGTHRIAYLCKEYGFNKNDNIKVKILEINDVVVVFPCEPVTAIFLIKETICPNISPLE